MLDGLERNQVNGMLPGNGERGICIAGVKEIVGSVIVAERGAKAYIWGLYVKPEHQKRGYGTRLLAAACDGLPQEITIEVRVLFTSEPAISFYKKHNFVEVETERTELLGNVRVSTAVMVASVEEVRRSTLELGGV
jgi:ribosomal protein S18 acetylase RimI-like enzyme